MSGYRPSPRPTFEQATAIRQRDVTLYTWGDEESGEVLDWLYLSSAKVHQLIFGLPVGGWFRHSDEFRTIFAADEVLIVLEGTMACTHPVSGETHRVTEGEAVFFRRDTWHHAYAVGDGPLRVLEFFAPPPAAGAAGPYARAQPLLTDVRLADDARLGNYVPCVDEPVDGQITTLRAEDRLWRLEEAEPSPLLMGIFASTEHITVGDLNLRDGQLTPWRTHSGDLCGYVSKGRLRIAVDGPDARRWLELESGDGFYVPEGVQYRYHAYSSAVHAYWAVAPSYEPHAGMA